MLKGFDFRGWFFEIIRVGRIKTNVFLFNRIIRLFCILKGVELGRGVTFIGYPIINRSPNSSISIGKGGLFNSSKNSVRIVLNNRCIFTTINRGAKITIGNDVGMTALTIASSSSVEIGNNVLIGTYCTIVDTDFHNSNPFNRNSDFSSKPVIIEDNVFLGMNCMVLKGVRIGKNSAIGANSVVFGDIPENSIAIGNPCKVIIRRDWDNPKYKK